MRLICLLLSVLNDSETARRKPAIVAPSSEGKQKLSSTAKQFWMGRLVV